jgi:hypothetical protein
MWKSLLRLKILLIPLAVAGCGGSHGSSQSGSGGTTNTFTNVQTEVFTPSCALTNCHDTSSHQSGLDLSAGQSYVQIVNVASAELPSMMRISPDSPDNSYLFQKISSSSPPAGTRMPPDVILPDNQINLVKDWILRGAPND